MRTCMVVAMVLAVACSKKQQSTGTGSGSATGSGSSVVAVGSGSAAGSGSAIGEPPPAKCDLAGKYRVRFTWNGTDGYWLRFSVGGTPPAVTLDAEPHMLDLDKKVDATLDTNACTIAMVGGKGKPAERRIELQVNTTTHAVTGKLVRPAEKDPKYHDTPIQGVHDVGTTAIAKPDEACFQPGVYEIAIDKKAKWKNTDEGDDRSCKETPQMFDPIFVRVELLGSEVTLDTVEGKAPYRELALVDEEIKLGKCEASFKTFPEGVQLHADLKFALDKVTGVGKHAEYQFVEDGDAGENIWSCKTENIPLTIKRVATP